MRPTITKDLAAARAALERVKAAWDAQPAEHLPEMAYSVKELEKLVGAILGDYDRKPALLAKCKELARKASGNAYLGDRFAALLAFVPAKRFQLDRFKVEQSATYEAYCETVEQEKLSFKARAP